MTDFVFLTDSQPGAGGSSTKSLCPCQVGVFSIDRFIEEVSIDYIHIQSEFLEESFTS